LLLSRNAVLNGKEWACLRRFGWYWGWWGNMPHSMRAKIRIEWLDAAGLVVYMDNLDREVDALRSKVEKYARRGGLQVVQE